MPEKFRIIMAKPGLDGHDRGAKVVARALREQGVDDVIVFGGGIIPKDDIPKLQEAGIEAIFTPGTPTGDIVAWLNERLARRDGASGGLKSEAPGGAEVGR